MATTVATMAITSGSKGSIRRAIGGRSVRRLHEIGPDREQLRTGVGEDEIDLVGIEHEVDRHQDRADPRHREAQRGEAVRIARQHRDAIALRNAKREQAASEPVADRIHLREGPAHLAADQRGLGHVKP